MKSRISSVTVFLLLASFVLMIVQSGCSNATDIREVYDVNIKKLHICYTMYLEDHAYVGPKDEEEFKDYLKNNPTAAFLMKKIDLTPENVDEIFISQRDNEPFVVRYGLKGIADHAIVFEATGVEGKRMVALTTPIEMDNADYEGYLSGKIKGESAPGGGDEFDTGE